MEFCDLVVINYKVLKNEHKDCFCKIDSYWDYFNILDQSEFMIVPPGAQYDTCRYNEALMCNCIPLQMHKDGMVQFVEHPFEYEWTEKSLENFEVPRFRNKLLLHLQKNIDDSFISKRISSIINNYYK